MKTPKEAYSYIAEKTNIYWREGHRSWPLPYVPWVIELFQEWQSKNPCWDCNCNEPLIKCPKLDTCMLRSHRMDYKKRCRYCDYIEHPWKATVVYYQDDICLVFMERMGRIVGLYKQHTGQVGGKDINHIVDVLLRYKKTGKIKYEDKDHWRAVVETS